MNHKNLLIIFTRNPVLGKVKTRLAKTVGDKTALDIYTFLLKKTKEITLDSPCDKVVYYSEKIIKNDIWKILLVGNHSYTVSHALHLHSVVLNTFNN